MTSENEGQAMPAEHAGAAAATYARKRFAAVVGISFDHELTEAQRKAIGIRLEEVLEHAVHRGRLFPADMGLGKPRRISVLPPLALEESARTFSLRP
jgi:hypothetical protein